MLNRFKSYQLAKQFYLSAKTIQCPRHLKDQLLRASSSIGLNLAEGSVKTSTRDRKRFYEIALGSTRECEAIIGLLEEEQSPVAIQLDVLARHIYKLTKAL